MIEQRSAGRMMKAVRTKKGLLALGLLLSGCASPAIKPVASAPVPAPPAPVSQEETSSDPVYVQVSGTIQQCMSKGYEAAFTGRGSVVTCDAPDGNTYEFAFDRMGKPAPAPKLFRL